ncbi:MAG: Nif3-like dinuclear metal center hexameric protein [Candidatus Brocadiia bacterium]
MKVRELARIVASIAPVELAEEWDNVGLIVGFPDNEVSGIALCLDITPHSVTAAVQAGANVIVCHHPPIFGGIKRVVAGEPIADSIIEMAKAGISCIAAHTNLDFVLVSRALAEKLGARVVGSLKSAASARLLKFVVFVPHDHSERVRDAICAAGAGNIGNYSDCTFALGGEGTFKGNDRTSPFIGQPGSRERVGEDRIETVVPARQIDKIIAAARAAHPYEEMAFDVYPLENRDPRYAMGVIGEYDPPIDAARFLELAKEMLGVSRVECVAFKPEKKLKKVAFAGGAAFDCYQAARRSGCAAFVTGEAKYHELFNPAGAGYMVFIVGHGPSEAPALEALAAALRPECEGIALSVIPPVFPSDSR